MQMISLALMDEQCFMSLLHAPLRKNLSALWPKYSAVQLFPFQIARKSLNISMKLLDTHIEDVTTLIVNVIIFALLCFTDPQLSNAGWSQR